MDRMTSSGLARSIQVIDVTGYVIAEGTTARTGASVSSNVFTLNAYGEQVPVETLQDKLAAVREKSHSELGDAWSRLAQM